MFESTAVWAEEKVFPQINDYLGYVRAFAQFPGDPITKTYPPERRKSLKIYGSAVWNHWLDSGGGGYGDDADPRRLGALRSDATRADFALAAYDRAIEPAAGEASAASSSPFAAATAEWRTGLGNFPDRPPVSGREAQGIAAQARAQAASSSTTPPTASQRAAGRGDKLRLRARRRQTACAAASRWSAAPAARSTAG